MSNVWTAEEIGKLIEVEREDYEKKIHNDRASIQYKIRQLQASLEEKVVFFFFFSLMSIAFPADTAKSGVERACVVPVPAAGKGGKGGCSSIAC